MKFKKRDIIDCRLIKDKQGKSKGYAYIDFITPEAAQESLLLNGEMIKGKKILVALSEPPKLTHDDRSTLFLNNLPFVINELMIRDAMKDYVNHRYIDNIRIFYIERQYQRN